MDRSPLFQPTMFIALGIAIISIGFFLGRFVFLVRCTRSLPVHIREEVSTARVPVVMIDEVRGGKVRGVIGSGARLFIGGAMVIPRDDDSFEVDAGVLLRNVEEVLVPSWANFVASKRGRKYYPVSSSSANSLVPENRVYFATEEEAEGAGYVP